MTTPGWKRTPGSGIRRLFGLERRLVLTLILAIAVTWSAAATIRPGETLHSGGLGALGDVMAAAFRPDVSGETLRLVSLAAFRTLMYAAAGMSIALAVGLPLGLAASGVLVRNRWLKAVTMTATRALLAVLRSVHELVWAVLLVFALGLSPVAGVLAIGVPYGGILGRVIAERLNDAPEPQLAALRASGASGTQVLLYGRLPMALPDLVSYLFYRLECAVRAAAVLSFVGLGGLGFRITIALDDLRYDQAWTSIYALVLLIVVIDIWSAAVRRRLV